MESENPPLNDDPSITKKPKNLGGKTAQKLMGSMYGICLFMLPFKKNQPFM